MSVVKSKLMRLVFEGADFSYIINNIPEIHVCDAAKKILEQNHEMNFNIPDFYDFGFRILLTDRRNHFHLLDFEYGFQPNVYEVIDQLYQWHTHNPHPYLQVTHHKYVLPLHWAGYLFKEVKQIEKCVTLRDLHDLLLICGDIEENPGPVMSKIRAQIGFEVHHTHSVDLASIFQTLDDDVFTHISTMCEKAGYNVGDKFETIKNRTVVTVSMLISIYRWSYGQLATPDLINSLTTSLLVAVPAVTIGRAMKMIFSGTIAQSGSFNPQTILRAICICFFLVTCSKLPGKGTIDEFIVRVRNIPQALKSLEGLWETIGPITKQLTQLLEKHVLGYDTSAQDVNFIGSVQAWADDVATYSDLYKKRLINRSSEAMEEAAKLHPRGIKLAQECIHNQYDRKNLELIRSFLPTTFKISEFALKSGADQCSVRPEPVIVWFQGDSGVGKSTLLYPFIQDMMKACGIGCNDEGQLEKDWQKRIYARMPETKFWSGYNPYHHDVIIIDEAFQLRDSALNPSPELFEIIRLGNMFPYMLYMDSIEQKANTFSRAKLIVLTSNVKQINIESLNCPEAVKRRITRAFATELAGPFRKYYEHQGHKKYMLDKEKVAKPMDLNVYEFQMFDTMSLDPVGPPMNYPIMLYECASKLRKNLQTFTRYDEELERNRTAPIPDLTARLLGDLETPVDAQIGDDEFYDSFESLDDIINATTEGEAKFVGAAPWKSISPLDAKRQEGWKKIDDFKQASGVYSFTQTVSPRYLVEHDVKEDFQNPFLQSDYERACRIRSEIDQLEREMRDLNLVRNRPLTGRNSVPKQVRQAADREYERKEARFGELSEAYDKANVCLDIHVMPPDHRKPTNMFEAVFCQLKLCGVAMKQLSFLPIEYLVNHGWLSHSWDDYIRCNTDPTELRYKLAATQFLRAYDLQYGPQRESYEGVIFGEVGDDGEFIFPDTNLNQHISVYKRWTNWFEKKYRELRFNLPSIIATAIGLAVSIYFVKKVHVPMLRHLLRPRDTLKTKFAEIEKSIEKAEECARKGCENCKSCQNVTEKDFERLDYWGVSCICYARVCDRTKDKNKRLFVAYLSQHKQSKIETEKAEAQMCDFARSCVCEKCPLCKDMNDCECLRIAIQRGCSIDEINLVDKMGLYDTICGQSRDPRVLKQNVIRIQSKDPKLQKPSVVRIQSKDPKLTKTSVVRVQIQDMEDEVVNLQGGVMSQARDIASDVASENLMNNVVYGSLLWMYVAGEHDDVVRHRLGHVLMIKGKIALMNWHFITALQDLVEDGDDSRIVLRTLHGTVFAILKPEDLTRNAYKIGEKDACLVFIDKKGVQFRDLTKHFISKEQRLSMITECMQLARYNITSEAMKPHPIMITDATLRHSKLEVQFDFQGREHSFICPTAWEYSAPTVNGDCGSPLILYNCRVPTKITGIHNARGGDINAYGVPLYREEIEKTLQLFPAQAQFGWVDDLQLDTLNVQNALEGKSFIIMQAKKGQLPQANQSQVKPSPIFGEYIETMTKPGPLRPFIKDGEEVDPAAVARAKWGGIPPDVDPEYAAQADEVVRAMCLKSNAKEHREYTMPLTYEEAVVGIPGVDYVESINKMSSPGYPYVLGKAPGKGKTGYFGKYDFDLTNPNAIKVKEDVDKIEKQYLNNERPLIVWIDTLKDQRIPIEKADAGKTRVFSAGPMHYTILFRKHVLPFIAHLNANRIDNMFGPGVNPVSVEWHKLALMLKSKGPKCIAGDYKQWDGWAPTRGYESFYDAALSWYELHWDDIVREERNVVQGVALSFDEYSQFFRNMVQDVISHVHLCNKKIDDEMYMLFYLVTNGLPSGCPSTANTNSACNLWAIAYCYFEMFAGTEFATVDKFFEYVYAIFYGDDIAMNIGDTIIEWFNQLTLTDAMKRNFNLTFTDEAKTGDIVAYRSLTEITFLKRSFTFNPDIQLYTAPLPEDLLLDILNWVRVGGENPYVITIDNLKGVLGEMSLHGREMYNKYRPRFMKTLYRLAKHMNVVPCFDTYYGYINKVRAGRLTSVNVD